MKNLKLFLSFLLLINLPIFAQTKTLDPIGPLSVVKWTDTTNTIRYSEYGASLRKIGREDGSNGTNPNSVGDSWRTEYQFNIGDIPTGVTIDRVTIRYSNSSYMCDTCKFEITHTTGTKHDGDLWNEIYNSGQMQTNLLYKADWTEVTSDQLKALIGVLRAQGKDKMFLGVFSLNENSNETSAGFNNLGFSLIVEYSIYINIWADNNFDTLGYANKGRIYVNDFNIPKIAPYKHNVKAGNTVNLKAIENQIDVNSHARDWNGNQSLNFVSEWKKFKRTLQIPIIDNKNIQYNIINILETDDSMRYEANLRKHFKMFRTKLTEFDGTQQDGIQSKIFEQNNGSITTPTDTSINGRNYKYAGWTDNISLPQTRTINNPTDNQTYTALYKVPHKSNQTNAYSNTSQRRFVQTPDGVKHICYESMNKVWYELSTDNGATWILGNGGKSLSSTDAKNPSMSFYGNQLGIVWQEKNGGTFNIKLAVFYSANYASSIIDMLVSSDGADYSYNANPVVGWGYNGKAAVVWSGFDMCENPFGGTALKYWYGDATSGGISQLSQCAIAGTDANSINPTITANYSVYSNPFYFHFAWQQVINSSTSKINYCKLYASGNNLANTTFEEASLNSGFSKNYNPVIVLKKFGTSEYIYVTWLGNRTSPTTETKVLLKYKLGTNWSTTGVYGTSPVQNFSINKGTTITNNQEPLALCWSEPNDSSFSNKIMKSPGSGTILTLSNLTGRDMQINNGTTFSSMFANSFSSASLPYSFSLSQNFGSINKENSMKIFNGREGVVGKNGAQFFFALGDISINGQNINFISVPDTVSVSSLPLLNAYFESEPFTVNSSSNLIYGVQYGITDSLLCSSALSENEQINFKVELLDALTNEVLGVYDEVTYNKQNVYQYNNMGYQVNLSGIGNRPVKFKLVTNTNAEFGYSLSNITADKNILAKESYQTVNYKGNLAVTEYDLAQNFPNPFNPNTTIRYQIPQDGIVTLKIYDILGSEIATLVNEEKLAGKYEVNFNASSLASGVYIYKIQAGSFVNSKKMILLK